MLLPIGLIRNLQIPLSRKLQIGGLFALGILVIIASIIRVVQVNATTGESNTTPSLTWLALWSIIESSVARSWWDVGLDYIEKPKLSTVTPRTTHHTITGVTSRRRVARGWALRKRSKMIMGCL
jgi:hypothetical protein